jgi:hypothetical protein
MFGGSRAQQVTDTYQGSGKADAHGNVIFFNLLVNIVLRDEVIIFADENENGLAQSPEGDGRENRPTLTVQGSEDIESGRHKNGELDHTGAAILVLQNFLANIELGKNETVVDQSREVEQ